MEKVTQTAIEYLRSFALGSLREKKAEKKKARGTKKTLSPFPNALEMKKKRPTGEKKKPAPQGKKKGWGREEKRRSPNYRSLLVNAQMRGRRG